MKNIKIRNVEKILKADDVIFKELKKIAEALTGSIKEVNGVMVGYYLKALVNYRKFVESEK